MTPHEILAAVVGRSAGVTGWIRVSCPACTRGGQADHKRSLGVHVSGSWHCFRCGAKGHVDLGGAPASVRARPVTVARLGPPEGFYSLGDEPGRSSRGLEPARAYLARRGVSASLCREAGIGACVTGRYRGRVIVPVRYGSDWAGFVARSTAESERPYLYPAGMSRGQLLYNSAALDVETDAPLFVVEGVFDALWLWPDAVAVLGKPTPGQVEQIAGSRRPIAVCLDADAWQEGRKLAWRLRQEGCEAGNIRLPPCLDPDELDREALRVAGRLAATCEEGEPWDARLAVEVPDTRYDALYGRGEAYEAAQRAREEERQRRYDEVHRDTPWTDMQLEIKVIVRPDGESEADARARLAVEQTRRRSVWRPGGASPPRGDATYPYTGGPCRCLRCAQVAQGA